MLMGVHLQSIQSWASSSCLRWSAHCGGFWLVPRGRSCTPAVCGSWEHCSRSCWWIGRGRCSWRRDWAARWRCSVCRRQWQRTSTGRGWRWCCTALWSGWLARCSLYPSPTSGRPGTGDTALSPHWMGGRADLETWQQVTLCFLQ